VNIVENRIDSSRKNKKCLSHAVFGTDKVEKGGTDTRMEEKRIAVEIYGERIFLLSTEAEEYLKSLAEYVDAKMIEIFKFRKLQGEKPMISCMLLGLNIADELFKERQKTGVLPEIKIDKPEQAMPAEKELEKREINQEMESLKAELAALKLKNKKLHEENNKLKFDLNKKIKESAALKREFDEYIETFGEDRNEK
jgi:cell division protein ZapA